MNSQRTAPIRLLASDQRQVEGEALRQLEKSAFLDGMEVAVGLPDLHPGAGNPVGSAFLSRQKIYPHIVGSDVGCGIGLWKTSLKANKTETAIRVTHLPTGLCAISQQERSQWLNKRLALARLRELLREEERRGRRDFDRRRWRQHDSVERGNTARVFKGFEFKPAP